jgi:hypothetical protein
MTDLRVVEVMSTPSPVAEFDYGLIADPKQRDWAESAAGFITFGLGQAVVKVLEAGNLLIEAQDRLKHGEYLPWVEQACGLKPSYAAKLVKAAQWVNVEHAPHLNGITDATTLFLLSAEATPEEVRQWALDRCAAGDFPSRKEVQDRKRQASSPRQPQPAEAMALNMIRKGDVDRIRQALALADRAETVTAEQVMAEQRLRELPKAKVIHGLAADFHRLADGQWVRLPHAGEIDVQASVITAPAAPPPQQQFELAKEGAVLTVKAAAAQIGMRPQALSQALTPASQANRNGPLVRKGYLITREGRGLVQLLPVASQCGASDGTT